MELGKVCFLTATVGGGGYMTALVILCTLMMALGIYAFSMLFMLVVLKVFDEEGCN